MDTRIARQLDSAGSIAYTVCMKHNHTKAVQFTVRKVPVQVDKIMKRRARSRGTSLNTVLVEALCSAAGLKGEEHRFRDLDDLFGSWAEDREFDTIIRAQDSIDKGMWR